MFKIFKDGKQEIPEKQFLELAILTSQLTKQSRQLVQELIDHKQVIDLLAEKVLKLEVNLDIGGKSLPTTGGINAKQPN
jgi:hypothetical protein